LGDYVTAVDVAKIDVQDITLTCQCITNRVKSFGSLIIYPSSYKTHVSDIAPLDIFHLDRAQAPGPLPVQPVNQCSQIVGPRFLYYVFGHPIITDLVQILVIERDIDYTAAGPGL
jgi:hypothetical protein